MSFDIKRMLQREVNVGLKEQKLRYGVGAAMLVASIFILPVPLLLAGAVLVATGFTRWCPVYSGMSKSSVEPGESETSGCCGQGHDHSH